MCTQKPASFDKNLRYAKLKRSGISLGTHRYSRRTILFFFFFFNDKRDQPIRNEKKAQGRGKSVFSEGLQVVGRKLYKQRVRKFYYYRVAKHISSRPSTF